MTLRLGSRGSRLALWQAEYVQALLDDGGIATRIEVLRTTGDRITDVPLARIGDTGLFTRELDRALLDHRIDLAVHSLKDVPTALPDGLALTAVLPREDPYDAFLPGPDCPPRLADLPAGARIGTSSLRRRALLLASRPDVVVHDLRGNLDTRFERLRQGVYDGIVLALAGVRRLGHEHAVGQILEPPAWLPAAAQGALAVVTRQDDDALHATTAALDHADTRLAVTAERSFLHALEGGCQVPIGALAHVRGTDLALDGFVATLDGRTLVRGRHQGVTADADEIGRELGRRLLSQGGQAILEDLRRTNGAQVLPPNAP